MEELHWKILGATLIDVLERADYELRFLHPDLFETVDRIKSRPGWVPHSGSALPQFHGEWAWKRCMWCDEWFVSVKVPSDHHAPVACSPDHAFKYAGLLRRDPSKPESRYR